MNLADFIQQDLKARLLSGKGVPGKLTLVGISEHYDVSMTPVRLAIGKLIDEGIIRKQANGRLMPNLKTGSRTAKAKKIERPLTAADWDRIMLREIMLTSLEPHAVYLREEAMARKHDVGRSVVRATLSRLATPGLLEHVPRCGWLVSPVHEEKMKAYLQIREALELTAMDLARPHMEDNDLKRMLKENRVGDKNGRPRMDNSLHLYWVSKSNNFYIQAFFEQHIARYYAMLFEHAAPEVSVVSEMAGQHRTILTALLDRDARSARHALSEHIWTQESVLKKLLARQSTEDSK